MIVGSSRQHSEILWTAGRIRILTCLGKWNAVFLHLRKKRLSSLPPTKWQEWRCPFISSGCNGQYSPTIHSFQLFWSTRLSLTTEQFWSNCQRHDPNFSWLQKIPTANVLPNAPAADPQPIRYNWQYRCCWVAATTLRWLQMGVSVGVMDTLKISSLLHSYLCPDLRQRQNNVTRYSTVCKAKVPSRNAKVHVTATAAWGREENSIYKYIPATTPGKQKNILRVLRQ